MAHARDLPFVSLQEAFAEACRLASPGFWAYDGIHPTHAGAEIIARQWLQTVSISA